MIARLWKGWTESKNADAYEGLLKSEVLPAIHKIKGHRGAYLLRKDNDTGSEFMTVTFWESIEAVKEFAGEDYEKAVVPMEARKLLSRFDEKSTHYEAMIEPEGGIR